MLNVRISNLSAHKQRVLVSGSKIFFFVLEVSIPPSVSLYFMFTPESSPRGRFGAKMGDNWVSGTVIVSPQN